MKLNEVTYDEDTGKKSSLRTYYKTGNVKTNIDYKDDGETISYLLCRPDLAVSCLQDASCPGYSERCTSSHDLPHTNTASDKTFTIYHDPAKTKKLNEYTYHENGNVKTKVWYEDNGATISGVYCYTANSMTLETCTTEKHGCSRDQLRLWTCSE